MLRPSVDVAPIAPPAPSPATEPRPLSTRSPTQWPAAASVLAAVLLLILFPGDTQFRGDEQNLVLAAAQANLDGRLVAHGLVGSAGVRYGPLPAQFYQLLLLGTPDLRTIVLLRAALLAAGLAAALWSIGKSLGLKRGFVALAMVAPWVWFYVRTPWDNTLALPLGCGLLAVYLRWLDRPTRSAAFGWAALATLLPLVHPTAIATPLAVVGHAVTRRFAAVRRSALAAGFGVAVACSTSLPYLLWLPGDVAYEFAPGVSAGGSEPVEIAAYALRAPELLGAAQSFYRLADDHSATPALAVAARVGWASYVWFGAGVVLIAARARRAAGNTAAAGGIAVAAVLLLGIILAVARVNWHPHYVVAVYAPAVVICWIGVDAIWSNRAGRWVLVILPAAAVVGTTLTVFLLIHRHGGGSNRFGHSIGTLMGVVDALDGRPVARIYTDSGDLHLRRQTLADLRWIAARGRRPAGAEGEAVVRLRREFAGDHRLAVEFRGPTDVERERFFEIPAWRPTVGRD